jgi:hypothetical protein
MDRHYAYLGAIAAVFAIIGLIVRYLMPAGFTMGYDVYVGAALFIIGFLILGYGFTSWRWPVWLGSILVMIAFIASTNALVLWFVLALGLGAITYAYRRTEIHQTK